MLFRSSTVSEDSSVYTLRRFSSGWHQCTWRFYGSWEMRTRLRNSVTAWKLELTAVNWHGKGFQEASETVTGKSVIVRTDSSFLETWLCTSPAVTKKNSSCESLDGFGKKNKLMMIIMIHDAKAKWEIRREERNKLLWFDWIKTDDVHNNLESFLIVWEELKFEIVSSTFFSVTMRWKLSHDWLEKIFCGLQYYNLCLVILVLLEKIKTIYFVLFFDHIILFRFIYKNM